MKTISFYFDPISPYVYLAWTQLEKFSQETGAVFEYIPTLFAGLLNAHGQKGPAEIPSKRIYTFKDASRWAHHYQVPLKMPPLHPFNPLLALRLCVAAEDERERQKISGILIQAVWKKGFDVSSEAVVSQVLRENHLDWERLFEKSQTPLVKDQLKINTAEAIKKGVFGVPSFYVDGEVFWGNDRLDFLKSFLKGVNPINSEVMEQILKTPRGIDRKQIQ